jgi:hypothetical protein
LVLVTLSRELIEALDIRAGDPRRFIDASEFARFRRYPRATPTQIKFAEGLIGFPLPDGLRAIYLEGSDRGLGPDRVGDLEPGGGSQPDHEAVSPAPCVVSKAPGMVGRRRTGSPRRG